MPLMDPNTFFDGADAVMNMNTHAKGTPVTSISLVPDARKMGSTRTERNVPKDDQHELRDETGVNPPIDDAARLHDPAHEWEQEHEWDVAQDRFTKQTFGAHPIDELGEKQELKGPVDEAEDPEPCADAGRG